MQGKERPTIVGRSSLKANGTLESQRRDASTRDNILDNFDIFWYWAIWSGGFSLWTQGLMWLSVTTPCFSGFWYVFRRTINLVSLVHCKTYHFYEQQVPGRCTGLTGLIWGPGRAKRRGGACGQDVWWKICIGTQRTNSMRQKSQHTHIV